MKIILLTATLTLGLAPWTLPSYAQTLAVDELSRSVLFLHCAPIPLTGETLYSLRVESTSPVRVAVLEGQEEVDALVAQNRKDLLDYETVPGEFRKPVASAPARAFDFSPNTSFQFGNQMMTVWSNSNMELGINPILVWRRVGSSLTLENVLDQAILTSIANVQLSEVLPLPQGPHLIIGRTKGGDGGESWGSLWIAVWDGQRKVRIAYQTEYSGQYEETVELKYKFDLNELNLSLFERIRRPIPESLNGTVQYFPWEERPEKIVPIAKEIAAALERLRR